jgi:hypothetical protein
MAPASVSGNATVFPKFEEFAQAMEQSLEKVQKKDCIPLLKCLYRAAKRKIQMERWRYEAPTGVENLRRDRKSMSETKTTLNSTLKILLKAQREKLPQLRLIEGSLFDLDRDQSFAKIIRYLEDAVEAAGKWKLVFDGLIPAELRDKDEKLRAKIELAEGIAAETIVSHPYPMSQKSSEIDHWFIGAAAECLDQYRTERGKKIPNPGSIIYQLFEAIEGRQGGFEGITKELRRQKKNGRPKLPFPDPTSRSECR